MSVHSTEAHHTQPRLVIFGGTGFFGRAITAEARRRGIEVSVVSRGIRRDEANRVSFGPHRIADVTRGETLNGTLREGDVVINLVGLSPLQRPRGGRRSYYQVHTRGTINVVSEAVRAGARGIVYVSALGVHRSCGAAYGETKAMAEAAVTAAPIRSTVVAPSILYGPGSEIVAMLTGLSRLPIVPIPTINAPFRPIHVEDAARLVVDTAVGSLKERYLPLVGPERLTAGEVAAHFLHARSTPTVSIPAPLSRPAIQLASRIKLPGAPADLAPMLAIDNAGGPPPRGLRLQRYTDWVSRSGT